MMPQPQFLSECPLCRSQAVQKVTAILHQGTTSGTFSGRASLGGAGVAAGGIGIGAGGASFSGDMANATALSHLLAPPVNDAARIFRLQLALVLGAGIISVAAYGMPYYLLFLPVALMVGFACYLRGDLVKADVQHRAQMTAWNRLYYCPRCDNVLDPGSQRHAPPAEISRLLS